MTIPPPRPFGWAGAWPQPKLLVLGEAWGRNEEELRQPFVGASGQELFKMLGEAMPGVFPDLHSEACYMMRYGNAWLKTRNSWLSAAGLAYTNVFNLKPLDNKIDSLCAGKKEASNDAIALGPIGRSLYLRTDYVPRISELLGEISLARPNCIVAAGATASWALLRASGIGAIRGTTTAIVRGSNLSTVKVLPTYHPAGVMRNWSWRPIVVADLIKAWKEAQFPELLRPEREVLIFPTLEEIYDWKSRILAKPPKILAIDIETAFGQITCIGFAESRARAIVIPFVDLSKPNGGYWSKEDEVKVWTWLRQILESSIPKLFQNGVYDMQYIMRMGIRPRGPIEDTMLRHHAKFPEMQKGLGFLGSIYTSEASWKLMRRPKADTQKRDE